jgi:hypothetical protein
MMTQAPAGRRVRFGREQARPPGAAPLLVVVLLACFAAASARAAEPPPDPDLSTKDLRPAGPFYVRPFLRLQSVGYDDNIRFDSAERQGDYTATVVPGFRSLLLARHRGGLLVDQEFGYVAFRDHTELNHWNAQTRARGILLLKPAILSLEDRYRTERERPNTEIDRRVRGTTNAVTAEVRTRREGRLGGRAHVRNNAIRYGSTEDGDEISRRLDRDERTLAAAAEFRIRPRTTLILEAALDDVNFRRTDSNGNERDTGAVSIMPGLRLAPSAPVQGEIKAGVIHLDALGDIGQDYRGSIYEGGISARLGHVARLKLNARRDLPFSLLDDNLYAVRRSWSAAFEEFFSRRLSAEITYGRSFSHYPEKVTRTGSEPFSGIRDDRLITYGASIKYRLGNQTALTVLAEHQKRDSTDDFQDESRNFFALGTTIDL